MSTTRCSRRRCEAFAPRTSTGGSARPASPTCRAARTPRRLAAVAPRPVDGDRRLEKSARSSDLPPHARAGRRTTERDRACAAVAAWSDLRARASQCGEQARRVGQQPDDIIGNRSTSAWGVGDDGVLQVLDRKKLLPPLMVPGVRFAGRP